MDNQRRIFLKAGLLSAAAPVITGGALAMDQASREITSFEELRKGLQLEEGLSYFNTGSLGPSPKPVIDAVYKAMIQLEQDPVGQNWGPLGKQLEEVREKAAKFIGAQKEETALLRNTTEGMNMVAAGIRLKKGDEVLTTTREHGSGLSGWEYLALHSGIKIVKVELPMPAVSEGEILERIKNKISPRTKIVMLSHINTITGLVMPLKKVSELTGPRDVLLVADGAQAAGMLPVDVKELGVDVYTTSGHKWMLGPKGTGILYIRNEISERIRPIVLHSSYQGYSASAGRRNVAVFAGLGKTFDIQEKLGRGKISQYGRKLAGLLRQHLKEMKGVEVISPMEGPLSSSIVSVKCLDHKNSDIVEKLRSKGHVIKLLPTDNALRFSCHIINTAEEVGKLAGELYQVVGKR